MIIDGCIRDFPRVKELELALWVRGVTPNFSTQTDLFPFAVNVPIACEERLILPVDVMFADNDGGVSGLCQLAEAVCAHARESAPGEVFAREQLATGSDVPHLLYNASGPCAVRGLVAGALTAKLMRENRNGAFLRGRS